MTLIELLIVISIMSVICVAIYQMINKGVKVWQRSISTVKEEDIAIFFEKVTQDVRNSFVYSLIPFEGYEFRLSFPTIVKATEEDTKSKEQKMVEQIGQVEYTYDFNAHCVFRRQWNYGQALSKDIVKDFKVLEGVDQVSFRYIYFKDEGEITTAEATDVVPASIEVTVKFSDNLGQRVLQKYIDLPIGM